jgi:hypothetical protein
VATKRHQDLLTIFERVHDRVEAVADDGVDALDAGLPKDVDQLPGQGRVSP